MPEWPDDPVTVIEPDRRRAADAADLDDEDDAVDDDVDATASSRQLARGRTRTASAVVAGSSRSRSCSVCSSSRCDRGGLVLLPGRSPAAVRARPSRSPSRTGWSTGEVGERPGPGRRRRLGAWRSGSGPPSPAPDRSRPDLHAPNQHGRPGRRQRPEGRVRRSSRRRRPPCCIPPGLTLNQIADRIGQLPGHSRETFLQVANSGIVRSKYQPADVNSLEGLAVPRHVLHRRERGRRRHRAAARRALRRDRRPCRLANSAATNGLIAVPDARRGVADPDRGQARRGRAADLGGDPQSDPRQHAAADRLDALLREGRLPAGADERRQGDRLAVQHLQGHRPAARRRSRVSPKRTCAPR